MIKIAYQEQLKTYRALQIEQAISEDLGLHRDVATKGIDVTAQLIDEDKVISGKLITREDAVIAGIDWFNDVFAAIDPSIQIDWQCADGERVKGNDVLCYLKGNARNILTAERSAMNFLQTLSGTATITARYVAELKGTDCRLLDTRKTIPMMRLAQKYAVTCGGGHNHRIGLYDAFLIKENHIASAGSLELAVERARELYPEILIEVEVENFKQLEQALDSRADVIMLDNFSLNDMIEGVAFNKAHKHTAKIEASGNVTLETLHEIAQTGVDFISVGALTKHVQAVDLSMRLEKD